MLNSKGISFVETLLSIFVLFIITGSLIPLSYQMKNTLYNKKLELHASETAYEAAKMIKKHNEWTGVNVIENVKYDWDFDGKQICIKFNNLNGERKKCINQEGQL